MVRKYLKVVFFGSLLFSIVYLLMVWLWASVVVDELLMETPSRDQAVQIQPRHLQALIRIEDPTFYEHPGLNLSNGQGVTTITSVVARDVFLQNHDSDGIQGAMQSFYRGVFDCCKRVDLGRDVMSLVLNSHATKQQQLNIFLNGTYLGSADGKAVIGYEAAANTYYRKRLSRLTDEEFYGLVAMTMAPNRYHPVRNAELHAQRVKRIAAVVTGRCEPDGWLDLTYEHCTLEP